MADSSDVRLVLMFEEPGLRSNSVEMLFRQVCDWFISAIWWAWSK